MNDRTIPGDRPKAARHHRGSIGVVDVSESLLTTGSGQGAGIFEVTRRTLSRLCSQERGINGENGASLYRPPGCFTVSIQDFKNLFRKKTEDSMQERAEKSRETDKLENQYDETTRNLEELIAEISNKKKHNG